MLHDIARHVDRHGQANALIAPTARQNRRVDSHQFPAQIHHCPAAVARVDRRVGLNKILVIQQIQIAPPYRAHNAVGHGMAQAIRIADCQHPGADFQLVRIAHRERGQVAPVNFEDRDIALRIRADQRCAKGSAIAQFHFKGIGACDDVIIGQDIPIPRNQDAGSQTLFPLFSPILQAAPEKMIEKRIARRSSHSDDHISFVDYRHHARIDFGRHRGKGFAEFFHLRECGSMVRFNGRLDLQNHQPDEQCPCPSQHTYLCLSVVSSYPAQPLR